MIYLAEMTDKHGFGDGAAIPAEAWAIRAVYVETLNSLAARNGSQVRAVAYDRAGFHNSCLILFVPAGVVAGLDQHAMCWGLTNLRTNEVELDDGMNAAIEEARELALEQYVTVKVRIQKRALADTLRALVKQGGDR